MNPFILLLLTALTQITTPKLSIEFVIPYPTSTFQCIHNSGFSLVSLRAVLRQSIDPNGIQNMNNARNAGLAVDAYVLSCRGRTVEDQINDIKSKVSRSLYGGLWIRPDMITSDEKCLWGNYGQEDNCAFLKSLVQEFGKIGIKVGIFTSTEEWTKMFGSEKACPLAKDVPLWWSGPDGRPSFDNFKPLAGWTTPNRKLFREQVVVCGVTMNMNYED